MCGAVGACMGVRERRKTLRLESPAQGLDGGWVGGMSRGSENVKKSAVCVPYVDWHGLVMMCVVCRVV